MLKSIGKEKFSKCLVLQECEYWQVLLFEDGFSALASIHFSRLEQCFSWSFKYYILVGFGSYFYPLYFYSRLVLSGLFLFFFHWFSSIWGSTFRGSFSLFFLPVKK